MLTYGQLMASEQGEGRPTKVTSKMIDDEIQFYYERNIGEMEAVSKTKHSWRTVHARYEKLDKLMQERKDTKFLRMQDATKEKALMSLDKQLIELITLQQQIITSVNRIKNPSLNDLQMDMRTKLAWMIFDFSDKKASLQMNPTVTEKVKEEIRILIDKYQNQPLTEPEQQAGK